MKILYEDEEKFHPDEIVSMPGKWQLIFFKFLCMHMKLSIMSNAH